MSASYNTSIRSYTKSSKHTRSLNKSPLTTQPKIPNEATLEEENDDSLNPLTKGDETLDKEEENQVTPPVPAEIATNPLASVEKLDIAEDN